MKVTFSDGSTVTHTLREAVSEGFNATSIELDVDDLPFLNSMLNKGKLDATLVQLQGRVHRVGSALRGAVEADLSDLNLMKNDVAVPSVDEIVEILQEKLDSHNGTGRGLIRKVHDYLRGIGYDKATVYTNTSGAAIDKMTVSWSSDTRTISHDFYVADPKRRTTTITPVVK